MCKIMPQADMTVIEGGTHFVFAEQPDAVNRAIENFLTRELKGENA
jgi:pimeloyl-ACP methyl ester carboxylesterase